ncbi:MAG: hypothetical protein Q9160_005530 [Pyrenula sp. 1 TL-2023]
MYQRFLLNILTLALTSASLVYANDYGVGFSLALDYGTASIHFAIGSSVDIIKIQGGPAYKETMRSPEFWDRHAPAPHYRSLDSFRSWKRPSSAYFELQSLRNHLPSWLGGQDLSSQPLSWMVNALKATAEAYLEAPISAAEVVFPFPTSELGYDAVRSTFSPLSLKMPMSEQPPAGILAARAYGIGNPCNGITVEQNLKQSQTDGFHPSQLILTVDYSDAALTALLVFEDCYVFEDRRVFHDTSIGASARSETPSARRNDLVRALRNITILPLEDGNGEELTQINELVLLGERADDHDLHEALKEVFQQKYWTGNFVTTYKEGNGANVVSPLFAASRGVAQDCWDRIDFSRSAEAAFDRL